MQNDFVIGLSSLLAPNKMYEEILFLFRGIEVHRFLESSCNDCHLRRSNAIRRKKRKEETLTRVKSAKKEIEKCIKNYGLLNSVEELQNSRGISG